MSLSLSHCILGQVWFLIVLIPDLCTLTYFNFILGPGQITYLSSMKYTSTVESRKFEVLGTTHFISIYKEVDIKIYNPQK